MTMSLTLVQKIDCQRVFPTVASADQYCRITMFSYEKCVKWSSITNIITFWKKILKGCSFETVKAILFINKLDQNLALKNLYAKFCYNQSKRLVAINVTHTQSNIFLLSLSKISLTSLAHPIIHHIFSLFKACLALNS